MTENFIFMVSLAAAGSLVYAITLLITHLVRRSRQARINARWERVLKRARRNHRRKMSRTHPSMKPWISQDTGRLHSTVR